MSKSINSKSVYQKFESAFSNVSAYAILKDGEHVANITLKYPKDGMGRLQCFMHILGNEMQNAFVSGCGYDKQSAVIHKTAKQYKEFISYNPEYKVKPSALELLELLSSYEASNGWDGVLYKSGFDKINVI